MTYTAEQVLIEALDDEMRRLKWKIRWTIVKIVGLVLAIALVLGAEVVVAVKG